MSLSSNTFPETVEMTPEPFVNSGVPLKTKKETAAFYAVTERTIDRWLLDGSLPSHAKVVIGGSVRFRTAVLLDHINASATTGNEGGAA
ncbi:MAG: DNA-binding protein [Rubripirellula sp.]